MEGLQESPTSLGPWPSPHPILGVLWMLAEMGGVMEALTPQCDAGVPKALYRVMSQPQLDQRHIAWGRRGGPTDGTGVGTRNGPALPPRLHLDPEWGQDPLPVRTQWAAQPTCPIWLGKTLANYCHESSSELLHQTVPTPSPQGPPVVLDFRSRAECWHMPQARAPSIDAYHLPPTSSIPIHTTQLLHQCSLHPLLSPPPWTNGLPSVLMGLPTPSHCLLYPQRSVS